MPANPQSARASWSHSRYGKALVCGKKVCLEVVADNVAALQLILRLTGFSGPMNQIARELALDVADASSRIPRVAPSIQVNISVRGSNLRTFRQVPFCSVSRSGPCDHITLGPCGSAHTSHPRMASKGQPEGLLSSVGSFVAPRVCDVDGDQTRTVQARNCER